MFFSTFNGKLQSILIQVENYKTSKIIHYYTECCMFMQYNTVVSVRIRQTLVTVLQESSQFKRPNIYKIYIQIASEKQKQNKIIHCYTKCYMFTHNTVDFVWIR